MIAHRDCSERRAERNRESDIWHIYHLKNAARQRSIEMERIPLASKITIKRLHKIELVPANQKFKNIDGAVVDGY